MTAGNAIVASAIQGKLFDESDVRILISIKDTEYDTSFLVLGPLVASKGMDESLMLSGINTDTNRLSMGSFLPNKDSSPANYEDEIRSKV